MKEKKHFLIETDILIEHLLHDDKSSNSILETAMTQGICFTTVINSAELYFAAQNEKEKEEVNKVMMSLKVLGLNSRYSLNISEFFNKVAGVRNALICSVAKNNDLPILTGKVDKFENSGLSIISPQQLRG